MSQLLALPESAIVAADLRAKIIAQVLAEVKRLWGPTRPKDILEWFDTNADAYTQLVTQAQYDLAYLAAVTTDEILAEQDYTGPTDLWAAPAAFAGVDIQGRPSTGVLYSQALKVTDYLDHPEGKDPFTVWQQAHTGLQIMTQTMLSDTSRQAKLAQMQARPNTKYVRMVRPPCCARCAILAGKVGENMDFKRHPGCDCDAVPVADFDRREKQLRQEGWIIDPTEYFHSLDKAEQNQLFTKAGAQAIRDGADINQVVNSRRGMDSRGIFTSAGTTKRGWASDYLREQYKARFVKSGGFYKRSSVKRMSVDEIYRRAHSSDEALVLLHANGYLTDASPDLSGKFSFFTRDADVLAAKKRVAAARRKAAVAAKKKATQPTPGTGGGKPPEPPRVWSKTGGGDDEIRRKHFQDLELTNQEIPFDHILKGKVRTGQITGCHDFERLGWIQEQLRNGSDLPQGGKTLFPQFQGGTQELQQWLGDQTEGVVFDALQQPDEIELIGEFQKRIKKRVLTPQGFSITLVVLIGKAKVSTGYQFKLNSCYPEKGGQGIAEVSQDGTIQIGTGGEQ